MAPSPSQVRETSISVSGGGTIRETGAAEAAGPLSNEGLIQGARMGNSEPQTSLDLTSESEQDFPDYLRVNNLIFLKLSKKARLINHECITSKNSKFPYAKLENLCADIKERVPMIHSEITKDFIWENVLVWLYTMQRSFEGVHDLKYDDKFNLILSEIIAEYIHYKCQQFAKNGIADSKVVTNEILAVFCVLFESNHAYILMTLLRINFSGCEFDKKYSSVLWPIFKKYLTKKFTKQSTDFSYSRLILCFKKWKSLVHEAKQKEKINIIAMGNFELEKYPTGVLPSEIPEREEKQLLAIFPLYKQAKNFQAKYGRNAGTRTLLRDDKSDLNKMISTYFKVFTASLKNGENNMAGRLEELSTPLEPSDRCHQQRHRNSRIMRKGDNNISEKVIDVIVLPDDDEENNVEKELRVENGSRCSEGDNNNNKNNSVNSSEIEQKSYGAFSDISSGHEKDEFAQDVAMPLNYQNLSTVPVVKRSSHTTETNVTSGIQTPFMLPNSLSNGTLFLSDQNHPNREVFVNNSSQQNESHLPSENVFNKSNLQNDKNLVNTKVGELNDSLRETILSSNKSASYDNLSDQKGDKTIHLPSKSLAVGSNMSQENSVNTTHCETRKEIFMRRCVDSDKIESPENKEMERDGLLLNNGKETKTNSESITSDSMKLEDSFAQNSAQSIQNKKNELDNISKQNNLSTEIYDTAKSEPILEAKETSEKPPVLQNEKGPAKELVPEKEQVLDDYPKGNERAEGLNIKPRFRGSMHVNKVRSCKEKETEKNTEDIAKEVFCLSTEIHDGPATIKPILEAKSISEKPPVLQNEEGPAKELVPEKEQVLHDYPKGNEIVEGLNIKLRFEGSMHANNVRTFKEKDTEENTEDIAKDVFCLSTEIRDDAATIKPILETKPLSEKPPVLQNEGLAKELVPEKEQVLDDYPKGNERAEGLNIKPRLRGSMHVNKVKSCKEKETEKKTKEVFCLSTEIHDDAATIKPILEAKPISEKPPVLQNEGPAKELVPEKEQVLHDYPKGNEIVESLNIKLRFEGSMHTNNVRSFKEKDTEENTEDIAKKVFCLSTEIRDDAATIKPILETKPLSEKPPVLENEGLAKELIPEKKQVLDDYPKGNERAEGLNIKPRLRGSMHVNKVRSCKEKETEKKTKEVFCLSTEIHDDAATIKPILEAKSISEKPPVLQNEEEPAKELVPEKEQVLHDYPKGNEIVEGLNLKLRFEGSMHANNVRSFKEKDTEENTEDIAKEVFCLSTEIRDDAATIKPILETKPLSEKPPVLQNEGLEKELVPEKEQVLDNYPKENERAEGLNIKPRLRGSMHVNKVRSCKEKETEKKTKEVFCLSTEIHDDAATIKPILEAKPISEKSPLLQNEEGPAKELVPEIEQVLHDYPKGNKIVEGLNIKLRFEGSMHANNVRSFKEKDSEENTEDIAKDVFCLSTEIRDDVATIKPILETKPLSEKPPVLQNEGLAKELVPDKKQVLDDYPKGNERAEGLNIKPRLRGSMYVNKVRSCKEKKSEKKTKEVFCLSTEIHDDAATIKPILEAKPISEKSPLLQNEEGPAKELVPEIEQVLHDYPKGNEIDEGLNIKLRFEGSMHANNVRSFKEKDTEENTEDIAKDVFCLSTEIRDDAATIKPILETKPLSEKPPVLQNEGPAKELVPDKKQVLDDYPKGNERAEGLNIKPRLRGSMYVNKVRSCKEKKSEKKTKEVFCLSTEIHDDAATIKPILEAKPISEKSPLRPNEEGPAKELVPEKEQVLHDYPKGNEIVEGLNIKLRFERSMHTNNVRSFKEKDTEGNIEDIAKKVFCLSTEIRDDAATIKPILETKPLSEKPPALQNEGPAKELVPDKKQVLDDYPKGNERAEGLNIKPRLRGSMHVNKVRSCKEKETEKKTKEVFCLSTEIHDDAATIKPILEAKSISEKPPVLQNEEEPAKELVPEKEQVLHDYPKGNEIVEGLNLKLRFEGSMHANNVRSFKEKDTEENTEDIAKEVFCLSTEIRDDAARIKPILETKPFSEKPPVLQNEGLAKELVPKKEQVLDDYPKGNERAEGLNINPHLRGSMHVNKVRSCEEKETEKKTKEVFCLSTEIHDDAATIKSILEAKPISDKPPVLQKAEGSSAKELVSDKKQVLKGERIRSKQSTPQKEPVLAKESVPEKEQVLKDHPKGSARVEGLNIKPPFGGSIHVNKVICFKEKEYEKNTEDIAKELFCLPTEIRDEPATIKPILEAQGISEKQLVPQNEEGPAKELVLEKEQVLDDYPKGNKRVEDSNIKLRLRRSMHVNKVRSCKAKETEKKTKEVFCSSTEIHDDAVTIKPILEAKPISEKLPVLQNEEGSAKELVSDKKQVLKRKRVRSKQSTPQKEPALAKESVPEKKQVLNEHPKGNERVEGLNIKTLFGGSMHVNKVICFKEKESEKNTEDIAKELFCLPTEIHDEPATIKPILEAQKISEKQLVPQNEEGPAKELVLEKEQVLDDYPKGNERVEDSNIKLRLRRSMHVNKVRSCKEKETEKKTKEVFCLSTEIHDDAATIKPMLEAKPISEKPPVLQKAEGSSAKELVSDKKQVLKGERIRSKQSTPQKEPVLAKESVPEKEQVLKDHPKGSARVEGLNIKPLCGGSIHVNKVISLKEKESEKNTEDIAKEVFCLSTEIHDPAAIKPILEAQEISEKPPVLQKAEGSPKELISDKKQVLKRERIRSKQLTPQKELASVKESVPKREQVLGDCPLGNERVEGLNMKSHLGGLIIHVNEEVSLKNRKTVKNTEDAGNKMLSLSTIKPIFEAKEKPENQPVPQNETGPAKELTSKTKIYTEIVNSAIKAIKPPCDNSNNKLETTLQNICKIDAVNENNQDEILRTQSVLKPEYVGGSKTNNIRRRRKSTNDTTKSKKRKMLTGNANLNHRAPANALEDAKDILSFQPKNNVQALQCMLVDAVENIQESQNSTGKKNVRVAEGMKNNSERRKSLIHKPNSKVGIVPVYKNETGNNIAQLVTKPLSKSITDENPISSTIVYGPKNDRRQITLMDKEDSLLAPSKSLIRTKPGNYNLQASQNSQTPSILKSLNLEKVETITKPSQCLNKPEESQALKQQIKNITNKDCILKASVDEGRKSPTILQEEQQEDINSIQLLNIDSKILKLENEETIEIPETVETNSMNDIKEQFYPIGVIKSPQSIVDKAFVAHDTDDDDSSSPAFSPLSNSSQINDDDAEKSPDYKKRHETTVEKDDAIPVITTCVLSNNEMTDTMQNSDENFPASLIAQLDDEKTMPNSEIFAFLSEISTVPLLDEEQILVEDSKNPIPLVSEVPKQEILSVTPSEESVQFQNFDWTGQVDFNIFENGNKTTSNVGDTNEIFTYPDYSHNFAKILDLIDADADTMAHLNTPNDVGRAGVKDVMCAQVLEPFLLLSASTNEAKDNTDEKNNVNVKNNMERIISTDNNSDQSTPVQYTYVQPTFVQSISAQSTSESFTTPVLPKTNQPMIVSLKVIPENDKKSNKKSNTETKSNDNSNEQNSVFELSTFKNSTHVLTKQPVGSMKVIPKTVDDTVKKGTAKSINNTISDRSKNVVQFVPIKPPSKLSAVPLTFEWQINKPNIIRNDKDKTEGNHVQEKSKDVQLGRDIQSYSVPDKNSPRVAPTKRPVPLNSDPERGQTVDLFEQVKNTPAPSQLKQYSFNGKGTVTLRRKIGNNIYSFEVKNGRKRLLEPFEFQPVTDAQLLEHLRNEKRKKLQS